MSYANNTISTPISLYEIGTVLGTNSGRLGYNIANGAIKTWAKFKPYRSTSLTTLGESARGDSPYYFGMGWPYIQSGTPATQTNTGQYLYSIYENDSASSARNAMNGWQYLRPRGRNSVGGDEWYRALDFAGYYHAATEPIVISAGSIAASTNTATVATISAIRKETFNAGEIDFSTMSGVKDYYYCLVGYRVEGDPNRNTYFVVSAASKISNGLFSANVTFNGANFPAGRLGTWYIYPCLCSVGGISFYAKAGDTLPSANYIPLPCTKRWVATVASTLRTADLYGRKEASSHTIAYYRLRINNDSTSDYNFTGVRVWFMHSYHTPDDVRDSDEFYIDFNDIYVTAGSSYDTGTTYLSTSIQSSLWPDLTLWATCTAGFLRVGPIAVLTPST